ncbi:uncharacterized protein LOC108864774 [Galendromus occidentalis]|uniref:Uncharacterized protein LOC108864774 n=1 Tax=Galendromus occidentalis TaxID=34638 RepID=A0AAJ7PAH8_9ACAR|nr:uncharacterized protein LOC108864774 [Galendromus occidentalis]
MRTQITGPAINTTLVVHNLDLVTSELEIEEALRKAIKMSREALIKVEKIRTSDKGERSALLKLAKSDAASLLKLERIKIGWETCRVREWQTVTVCFRCQELGHRAHGCKEKESKAKKCYRCGIEGHLTKECSETQVKCQSCETEGHSKYSSKCPNLKKLLKNQLSKNVRQERMLADEKTTESSRVNVAEPSEECRGAHAQENGPQNAEDSEAMQTEDPDEEWKLVHSRRRQNPTNNDDRDNSNESQ